MVILGLTLRQCLNTVPKQPVFHLVNTEGETPLQLAIRTDHFLFCMLLLDASAPHYVRFAHDWSNQSPIDLLPENLMSKLILRAGGDHHWGLDCALAMVNGALVGMGGCSVAWCCLE